MAGVAIALHQTGVAKVHEEQALTCPVTEKVAHTHDESCYDADGNLVCPLPELKLHTHGDECYDADGNLICNQPEVELHTHTDECYSDKRELTCGQEESDDHKHTDECYTVVGRELTCGKEEIKENHVHGPGCFTTITVEDEEGDAEAEADGEGNAEEPADAEDSADETAPEEGADTPDAETQSDSEDGGEDAAATEEEKSSDSDANGDAKDDAKDDAKSDEKSENKDETKADAKDAKDGEEGDAKSNKKDEQPTATEDDEESDVKDDAKSDKKDGKEADVKKSDAKADDKAEAVAMPAQEFDESILDDNKKELVHVSVKAPEGAFPANTTMKVKQLDPESVRDKVEDAIKKNDIRVTGAKKMTAVDITFFDEKGNEIEPAKDVEVKITSDAVRDIKDPMLVHVDKNKDKDAEVVKNVDVVHNEEKETKKGSEDTLKFESGSFSPYVIVEPETITADVITAKGETYTVTVSYGKDAGIPAGAKLVVNEVTEKAKDYDQLAAETAEAVETDVEALDHLRMFDITIQDADGNELEPKARVEVKIEYVGDAIADSEELKVVHLAEDGAEVIDPVTEGKEEGQTDTLTFTTESFSIYSVVSYALDNGATVNDLAGKSYAIVHVSKSQIGSSEMAENKKRHIGQALQASGNSISAASVSVEEHESEDNVVTSQANGTNEPNSATQITSWTFEPAGNGQYYIKADNGKYLYLNNNSLTLSNNKEAWIVEGGSNDNAGLVRISRRNNYNNSRYIRSNVSDTANSNGNGAQFSANVFDNAYCWLTLCQIQNLNDNPVNPEEESVYESKVYTAKKVSVSDLEDGKKYIVYKSVYDSETHEYHDYVIDGKGRLIKAYDKGDIVTLHSPCSPEWEFMELKNGSGNPNGYYIFKNTKNSASDTATNNILHPMAGNTLVKPWDEETSRTVDGVRLSGRENSEYTSTIEYWDTATMTSYGYKVTDDIELQSCTRLDSEQFSFAEIVEATAAGNWETVDTVDSVADGITIHMFDYPNQSTISNVTGSDDWAQNTLQTDYVQMRLGSDGYPVYRKNYTDTSGSALFSPSSQYHKGEANHLFIQSIYDSTKYYEYSCFDNFAKFNTTGAEKGNFTVYNVVGAALSGNQTGPNDFNAKRGNFLPFDELNPNKTSQKNLFNGEGDLLDYEDPFNGAVNSDAIVYGLKATNPNWFFGMTMDFNFLMPPGGTVDGNPMLYQFNGDDDLLIYIDGVLVLNIDGRHDAWPGSINFATGEIICPKREDRPSTIRDCFKAAGVFPDGTAWDDSKADQYFSGNTLKDYSGHSFKMFYMEHGAYASNLMMRFNLPTRQNGEVVVEKKLSEVQTPYANVEYAYKLWVEKENGGYELVRDNAVYENKLDNTGHVVPIAFDNDGVFRLKHGEAAKFTGLDETKKYYVQELGIDPQKYTVYINGTETAVGQDGNVTTTQETIKNRARVVYDNECTELNKNDLLITKVLGEGIPATTDTFEFRVLMENKNGELVPYTGEYYIRDDETGKYYNYMGSLSEEPVVHHAGQYGTIERIPAGKTVIIKDLIAGTDFFVDEIRMKVNDQGDSILIKDSDWNAPQRVLEDGTYDAPDLTNVSIWDYATSGNVQGSALGKIKDEGDKDAHVTFTNTKPLMDLTLKKTDTSGTAINGSEFNLTRKEGQAWAAVNTEVISPSGSGDATGTVGINHLDVGVYRLEEIKAPDGYMILDKFTYFKVEKKSGKLTVTITDENGNPASNDGTAQTEGDKTVVVVNPSGNELPATGGAGTTAIYATGAALVGFAACGLVSKKMRNYL
ncbi:MAG: hypothetical protein IKG21_11900 [Atopobiaceae bacterium]|nr:hypothetical protein [Atopobiaceae bacterium]